MFYRIAELDVEIIFSTSDFNNTTLIPSFSPFTISEKEKNDGIFFRLYVDDSLKPRRQGRERIGKFDTGNGDTVVDRFEDGSYQYIIKNINGPSFCAIALKKAEPVFFSR